MREWRFMMNELSGCDKCPMSTEETIQGRPVPVYHCKLSGYDNGDYQVENNQVKISRPKWCPITEVKAGGAGNTVATDKPFIATSGGSGNYAIPTYPKPAPYTGGYPPCYKESSCGGIGSRACPLNTDYDYEKFKHMKKDGCPYRSQS